MSGAYGPDSSVKSPRFIRQIDAIHGAESFCSLYVIYVFLIYSQGSGSCSFSYFMAFFLPNTKSPERSAVKHPAPFHNFGFSNAPCRIDALQPAFKLFLRITRNLAQENTEISNSKYCFLEEKT